MNKYRVYLARGTQSHMHRMALLELKPHVPSFKYLGKDKADVLVLMNINLIHFEGKTKNTMGQHVKKKFQKIAKLLTDGGWESAKTLKAMGVFDEPEWPYINFANATWKDYLVRKRHHYDTWCDRIIAYLERAQEMSREEST